MRIPLLFIGKKRAGVYFLIKITLFLHSLLHSFYTFCKECNLGWTDKKLPSHTNANMTKLKLQTQVSFGTMVNAQSHGNKFDRGMIGAQTSLPPTIFIFYNYTDNYTLHHQFSQL